MRGRGSSWPIERTLLPVTRLSPRRGLPERTRRYDASLPTGGAAVNTSRAGSFVAAAKLAYTHRGRLIAMETITLIGGREKRFYEEAYAIAAADPYWRDWPAEALAAMCEHRNPNDHIVRCLYCGCDLQQYNWHIDHLLPAGKYRSLDWTKLGTPPCWYRDVSTLNGTGNAVPCCNACNIAKHDKDPNTRGNLIYEMDRDGGVLSPLQRKELIARARKLVEERLAGRRSRIEADRKREKMADGSA
jgi:hypothetical protein